MSVALDEAAEHRQPETDEACFEGILPGRYSLEQAARADGTPRVFSCRARKVATDHMIVEGPVCGMVGERVKAWIEHFDLLSGTICETGDRMFRIRFHMLPKARKKFASKITWVRRHIQEGLPDLRAGKRIPMPNLKPVVILGNGHVHDCFIIDASSSGAAISADLDVKPGTRLALGCIVGKVVREIETGFAMKFDEEQAPETLRKVLGWVPYERADERSLSSFL
ncbi:MAG: hypothetical protein KKH72_08760 [Alphaproteobacteria bacterium]|nr:hypothetical protein [Alphaproteobacteria bacterium]